MNVVFIFSDQHNPQFCGAYGGITRTPNIDSIAASGTRFENAYTNSPLCVPSRASMFTSRYVHEIACWDNTFPYDGRVPGWGSYLKGKNVLLTTIGKIDFQPDADHGIEDERLANNRKSYDVVALYREPPAVPRKKYHVPNNWDVAPRGPGEELKPEEAVTAEAISWLKESRPSDRPWVLNINYQKPHSPWKPLPELYSYYRERVGKLEDKYLQRLDELHEVDQAQSIHTCGYLYDEERVKNSHAGYHATVEEMDTHVGRILDTLKELGIREEVLLVYTSDHGEMARAHGAWEKCSLYEDSIKVPMIISGPGIPSGRVIQDPVSLIDVFPTINEALGNEPAAFSRGKSLVKLARDGRDDDRADYVFSESQANGRMAGSFTIRRGDWKLVEYVGYGPLLFNLKEDPNEMKNLAVLKPDDPMVGKKLQELRGILYSICSPEGVDLQARYDQNCIKEQLAQSGRLEKELERRGFREENGRLVPLEPWA